MSNRVAKTERCQQAVQGEEMLKRSSNTDSEVDQKRGCMMYTIPHACGRVIKRLPNQTDSTATHVPIERDFLLGMRAPDLQEF